MTVGSEKAGFKPYIADMAVYNYNKAPLTQSRILAQGIVSHAEETFQPVVDVFSRVIADYGPQSWNLNPDYHVASYSPTRLRARDLPPIAGQIIDISTSVWDSATPIGDSATPMGMVLLYNAIGLDQVTAGAFLDRLYREQTPNPHQHARFKRRAEILLGLPLLN